MKTFFLKIANRTLRAILRFADNHTDVFNTIVVLTTLGLIVTFLKLLSWVL